MVKERKDLTLKKAYNRILDSKALKIQILHGMLELVNPKDNTNFNSKQLKLLVLKILINLNY